MPKISVITTTYKHQDFIAQTIESVLSQTYTDRELLIGDDSPDDATWNIIQDYVQRFPKKIKARHHHPNKGIVDNMNFLIQQSSQDAQYISFLEGDDKYLPNNLEEKMKIFVKYDNLALIYSDLEVIDKNSNIIETSWYKGIGPFNMSGPIPILSKYRFVSYPNNIMSYSSGMIKKNILYSIVGIRARGIKHCSVSDWDFYYQVVTTYPSFYINKSLLQYRIHDNNFSKKTGKIGLDLLIVFKNYINNNEWNVVEIYKELYNLNHGFNTAIISKIKILLLLLFPFSRVKNIFTQYIKCQKYL